MLLGHEKEGSPAICNNLNEPGGQCAEWNKSEKEEYSIISPLMWNLNRKSNLETKRGVAVAKHWRVGSIGRGGKRYVFSGMRLVNSEDLYTGAL